MLGHETVFIRDQTVTIGLMSFTDTFR
ncbi:hypothetical protein METHPM2_800025 [Pseudomonas sp. PM2]